MLFMIIEHFRNGDSVPVYRRFREKGRMAPDSVKYVGSWITDDMRQCYQVMEAPTRADLDRWTANWNDLVDFEVIPVITSPEAQARVAPLL